MPVKISNILVVAHITTDSGKRNPKGNNEKSPCEGDLNEDTKLQLIEETVQQVLEILERQKDR